jgi:MFS family permease
MDVLRTGSVFRLGAGFGINALLQTGIVTAIPQYFAATFHVSHSFGGMVTAGQMVTNACAAGSVGYFLSRGATVRSLAIAGTLAAIAAAMLIFLPFVSIVTAVGAALIFTIGTGVVTGIASALIPSAAPSPETIGSTSGLVFQLVLIGVLAGPPIVFGVLGTRGFSVLAVVITAAAAGSLALLPIWDSRQRKTQLAHATTKH